MATFADARTVATVADLLDRLGGISPKRVRFTPVPGTATEKDCLDLTRREDRLFELVDGTLVEKAVGYRESLLAVALINLIKTFVKAHKLGRVTGPDGMFRLFPGLARGPDVAFASWKRFPTRKVPTSPIPHLVPDLAIEVLSKSNTKKEMSRKRRDYFKAGVILVWEFNPIKRQAVVYRAPKKGEVFNQRQSLSGEEVLPGFALSLRDLFAELDEEGRE